MKKLPVGIQTFSELIGENYLYVDKTELIYHLIRDGGKYFFLSRPRRFGKSLLISTLAELFSGNRELFRDLWIYDKIQWQENPVIHIDFSNLEYENSDLLKQSLVETLDTLGREHGITLTSVSYKTRFSELIKKMSANGKVVILVDEYDKPIIDTVEQKEVAETNRKILANFYGVLKGADKYVKFAFLTGVSKFSKVSVFSGLNNLRDITLSQSYANLLGYTQEELLFYFDGYLRSLCEKTGIRREVLEEKVRQWYNGYSWDGAHFVYNPYSILSLFNEGTFDNFWFSTGTPTFLIRLIKHQSYILPDLDRWPVSSYAFDSYDLDHMEIAPLLFQTGYLTIKGVSEEKATRSYMLDYPNLEVRNSFLVYLIQDFTREGRVFSNRLLERVARIVEEDDIDGLMTEMRTLFASIPHPIFVDKLEAYYHTVVYLILKLAGADIVAEESTNLGRMDAVLETAKKIYVMEFKMESPGEALAQIKTKKYYEKYLNSGKEVVLAGIGFDSRQRNIGEYIIENLQERVACS